jgi:hypothetical protein
MNCLCGIYRKNIHFLFLHISLSNFNLLIPSYCSVYHIVIIHQLKFHSENILQSMKVAALLTHEFENVVCIIF